MALPKWITPAGNLGIVPSLEYYEFPLDAYDTAGGTLVYTRVSGLLPPGLQIIPAGIIKGIPVSTAGADLNEKYVFTIRVTNSADNGVSDRTFELTITNVAPPVITPRNVDLGSFFDGTIINIQLEAVEYVVEDTLTWKVKSGEFPTGLTLSPSGLISGYIKPITVVGPLSDPDWDIAAWDLIPWEPPVGTTTKNFTFSIEVTDGVNYDVSTYTMFVYPRRAFKSDSTIITVDTTSIEGSDLTVDAGSRHEPIITTPQSELTTQRAGSYFQFDFDAIDLEDDVLQYIVPSVSSGAFDEQILTGNSIPYIAATASSGNLSIGAYPKATIAETAAIMQLYSGNLITAIVGDYITQTISGANARVIANVTNSTSVSLINETGSSFFTSRGNLTINGVELIQSIFRSDNTWANVGVVPFSVATEEPVTIIDHTTPGLEPGDVIQILDEYPGTMDLTWYSATVNRHTKLRLDGNIKVSGNVGEYITQGLSSANAKITAITSTTGTMVVYGNLITANVGDYITQTISGANATVTANVILSMAVPITLNSGSFILNSGNIRLNSSNLASYPRSVSVSTDVSAFYNLGSDLFILDSNVSSAVPNIADVITQSSLTSVLSVGVTMGAITTQGTVGFDEGKFSQGELLLPDGLTINLETGWMTGYLPNQSINEQTYQFEVVVYKRDYPSYIASKLYSLTVLGDTNNTIDWLTSANLGTIQNGDISDLFVKAVSSRGKTLHYSYTEDSAIRLPQGLQLLSSGLISGRVSFQLFSMDQGTTTLDGFSTTFDNTYTFTVTASDIDRSISANRTFTVKVLPRNIKPYEDLYLKALLTQEQRNTFQTITQDQSVFPKDLIYRNEDPYYGVATDIKTLFLAGINPSTLSSYANTAMTNHYNKRITFGDVKTAVAVDGSYDVQELSSGDIIGTFQDEIGFVPVSLDIGYPASSTVPDGTVLIGEHTKYEVVYLEISDDNTTDAGQGPENVIDLTGKINPYYDLSGNIYSVAYPNAFSNMQDVISSDLGYANKGALPDWMTSRQPDGRVLGFTRAVVLAYTVAGASDKIAYRFNTRNFNLNELDFTVDRYQLDDNYSENYDIDAGAFITSTETTFDRYPKLSSVFTAVSTVDYAVSIPFESIHRRSKQSIIDAGGLDGGTNIKTGQTIVFAQQEFRTQQDIGDSYNQGWADADGIWDGEQWDFNANTVTTSDDLGWDASTYIPGYNEHNLDPSIANQRIGIWTITVDSDNFVTLTFTTEIEFNNKIYVRNGYTYGGTNIYFDPVVKSGNLVPNYSTIPQQIKTSSTRFDGNGTRFLSYRDEYSIPQQGDKYIKFAKTGVFT
jgi:hypothetical protein